MSDTMTDPAVQPDAKTTQPAEKPAIPNAVAKLALKGFTPIAEVPSFAEDTVQATFRPDTPDVSHPEVPENSLLGMELPEGALVHTDKTLEDLIVTPPKEEASENPDPNTGGTIGDSLNKK